MANAVADMTPIQFREHLPLQPKFTSAHYDWSGIRAEIRSPVVHSGLNLTGCSDHPLAFCLNNHNDAKDYPDGVSPPDRKIEGEMCLAPGGLSFQWALTAGRYLHLFIQPAFVSKVAENVFRLDANLVKLQGVAKFQSEPLHPTCLALHNELSNPGCGSKIYINSLATALAVLLLRHHSSVIESIPGGITTTSGLIPWHWQRVTGRARAGNATPSDGKEQAKTDQPTHLGCPTMQVHHQYQNSSRRSRSPYFH